MKACAAGTALIAAGCLAGCGSSPEWPDDIEEFAPSDIEEYVSVLEGVTSVDARERVVDDEIRWYVRMCVADEASAEAQDRIQDALAEAEDLMVEHAETVGMPSEYWSLIEIECDRPIPGS